MDAVVAAIIVLRGPEYSGTFLSVYFSKKGFQESL